MSNINKLVEQDDRLVVLDRMRYSKNGLSAKLVLLAIVLNVIYFVSVYQSDASTFYYVPLIGASVIYNLIFMLAAFLAEESVKNRKSNLDGLLLVIGVFQVVRIFILPMQAVNYTYTTAGQTLHAMSSAKFTLACVCLIASAVCCVVAAVNSHIQNKRLADYLADLNAMGGN